MKVITLVITGVVLSLLTILIVASKIEHGDINAASMYLVVFAMPTIVVILINGLLLAVARSAKSKSMKILLSVLPILLLVFLSLKKDLTFGGIDGNMVFVARVASVIVGATNIVWVAQCVKVGSGASNDR